MKEKFKRFKNEEIVVNVRSQKQYDEFMKMCEEQGLKWVGVNLPTTRNYLYNSYKEETCINVNNLTGLSYCDINYYKNKCYKIITYKDFIKKPILDEVEKKWLKNFIKSTNIKVKYIKKCLGVSGVNEYLQIVYDVFNHEYSEYWQENLYLPIFKKGTMYKGLELNKKYTLAELGLE